MHNDNGSTAPTPVDIEPSVGAPGHCLIWQFPTPLQSLSSSIVGGGMGLASWLLNMTVDANYARLDPDAHLLDAAARLGLGGSGSAMMTAVDVRLHEYANVDGVDAWATVGVSRPVWAAANGEPDGKLDVAPGTINLVVKVPVRLSGAALVNVVATVTEAKSQALFDRGVQGTGTASDAVCVLCEPDGAAEKFGGPRSTWGARSARAVYSAVVAGIDSQRAS